MAADAFQFLAEAAQQRKSWDLVIVDPPSFAASQAMAPKAIAAYQSLIGAAAAVTSIGWAAGGGFVFQSRGFDAFLGACEEGISLARRKATSPLYGWAAGGPSHPLGFAGVSLSEVCADAGRVRSRKGTKGRMV